MADGGNQTMVGEEDGVIVAVGVASDESSTVLAQPVSIKAMKKMDRRRVMSKLTS